MLTSSNSFLLNQRVRLLLLPNYAVSRPPRGLDVSKGDQSSQAKVSIMRTTEAIDIGKSNVVFRSRMPDNKVWIARPRNPLVQKSVVADKAVRDQYQKNLLESEIATMKYVRRKTNLPVPEVFASALDKENALDSSYIIMQCMNGKPYPYPFDGRGVMTDQDIIKIHSELINETAQLASLSFDQIGMLRLHPNKPDDIQIAPIFDGKGCSYRPFHDSKHFFATRAKIVWEGGKAGKASKGHINTAVLNRRAANFAAQPEISRGPFPLKHIYLH